MRSAIVSMLNRPRRHASRLTVSRRPRPTRATVLPAPAGHRAHQHVHGARARPIQISDDLTRATWEDAEWQ